jgi:hypothetical protein
VDDDSHHSLDTHFHGTWTGQKAQGFCSYNGEMMVAEVVDGTSRHSVSEEHQEVEAVDLEDPTCCRRGWLYIIVLTLQTKTDAKRNRCHEEIALLAYLAPICPCIEAFYVIGQFQNELKMDIENA